MARFLATDWMKVATPHGAVAINPNMIQQIRMNKDGSWAFWLASGAEIDGIVPPRLVDDPETVFNDLKAEAEG